MLAPQVHLMLTHLPVLGAVFAVAALAVGLLRRHDVLVRFALATLLVAAITAVPAYFSGRMSEEAVEDLAGVDHRLIESHERLALAATIGLAALGLAALTTLIGFRRRQVSRVFATALLGVMLAWSGVLAWTAHLGGQIRHAEIRSPIASTTPATAESNEGHEGERGHD